MKEPGPNERNRNALIKNVFKPRDLRGGHSHIVVNDRCCV
jgi:hypothetical protein